MFKGNFPTSPAPEIIHRDKFRRRRKRYYCIKSNFLPTRHTDAVKKIVSPRLELIFWKIIIGI